MRWWPAAAPLSVLLMESRLFVTTPSLSTNAQAHPDAVLVKTVHDALPGIYIGSGVSLLGLAAMVVSWCPSPTGSATTLRRRWPP